MNKHIIFLSATLLVAGFQASAQDGYIKFRNNQLVTGKVKVHYAASVHEHQVEITPAGDEANPKRYHKKDISEYAIHKDTFRILKEFYPYEVEEIYYELIDAKVLRSGKVSLLQIHNSYTSLDKGLFETLHDQNPSQVSYFYVLQDTESNFVKGVPSKKDKFKLVLQEFFSEEVLAAYEKAHGPVHFRDLEKLVAFSNTAALD
ncbi:MAG TPA: hypothetical protein VEB86_10255 [Chryseosolibacter sp.]|nr:hypothetical protein [Chryseosolibacter sp.]